MRKTITILAVTFMTGYGFAQTETERAAGSETKADSYTGTKDLPARTKRVTNDRKKSRKTAKPTKNSSASSAATSSADNSVR